MSTLGTEYNVESLNKAALDLIGKAEDHLAHNRLDEAKAAFLELDGVEKRRDELGEIETMRGRLAKERSKAQAIPQPHRHAEPLASDPGGRQFRSPGEMFTRSEVYQQLVEVRAFDNSQARVPEIAIPLNYSLLNYKSLILGNSTTSAGAFVLNDFQPGYVDILQNPMTFLSLIHRVRTSSDTIDWVKESTFTNAAVFVAEATANDTLSGAKPESALNWQRVTSPVETVAHWIPITNRALADAPQLQDIINGRLLMGLDLSLEAQVISGNGSSPNLTGLLNASILTQATASTENNLDTILKAMVKIEISGKLSPNAVVLNPINWQTMRLLRENAATGTLGQYLMGPPSMPGPMTIYGVPVIKSQALTANTALVGTFTPETHALFDREQAVVRMGYVNSQFTQNLVTMLAEMRAAFAVFRAYGFCSITGIA